MILRRLLTRYFSLSLFIILLLSPFLRAETKPVGFAVPFPELTLKQVLSRHEQNYLGVSKSAAVSVREIRGSLLLAEVISTYCVSCQRQAPAFNELYSRIEKDPKLKGKVKIIGIAAGNTFQEVEDYKRKYKIPYPIFADPKFEAHLALGSPRTPFAIWIRRDPQGKLIVVSAHLGQVALESALNETRAVLQYDLALLRPKKGAIYEGDALMPPLTEEELIAKAKEGMEASGGKVIQIEKISLPDGDPIYVGEVDFGDYRKKLFSKLASRRAVCDICHDAFFIYTFDPGGRVIDIVPIQLTKMGNLKWTEEDIRKLRSRTVGRSILAPFAFDPGADSVSGASITAVLIFDSLDKAKEIYQTLKKEGHLR